MPEDFNEARKLRASGDRSFRLGPFLFTRVVSAAPEVLIGFHRPNEESVDAEVIQRFDETILVLLEPLARNVDTGEDLPASEAWRHMRTVGDENGVVSFNDMGEVVKLLLSGVVERPTDTPSDSPDGSPTPTTGTPSMGVSPSPVPASMPSMPAAS